eukprot:gene3850-5267_t
MAGPAAAQTAAPMVDAPAGAVRGQTEGDIRIFKGIPYALPPVQGRRWQPPVAMPRWPVARDATAFGPACIQPQSKIVSVYSGEVLPTSEDCLTLNIWAPANARNAPPGAGVPDAAPALDPAEPALGRQRGHVELGVLVVEDAVSERRVGRLQARGGVRHAGAWRGRGFHQAGDGQRVVRAQR